MIVMRVERTRCPFDSPKRGSNGWFLTCDEVAEVGHLLLVDESDVKLGAGSGWRTCILGTKIGFVHVGWLRRIP